MTVHSQRVGWAKAILRHSIYESQTGEDRRDALAEIRELGDWDALKRAVRYARTLTDEELASACMGYGHETFTRKLNWIREAMATEIGLTKPEQEQVVIAKLREWVRETDHYTSDALLGELQDELAILDRMSE